MTEEQAIDIGKQAGHALNQTPSDIKGYIKLKDQVRFAYDLSKVYPDMSIAQCAAKLCSLDEAFCKGFQQTYNKPYS